MSTEGRGITLTQLEEIVAYVRVCAHCWCEMVRALVSVSETLSPPCACPELHCFCWCVNHGVCTSERARERERETRIWMVPRASPRMWQQNFMDRS